MGPDDAAPSRRKSMQANRRRDSKPEVALRSRLHAAGYRYRCDLRLVFGTEAVRPDIVSPSATSLSS
ncbi:hypothetical protein [Microbacterium oleivorans]|uniref:hypothetical protein n=1 Tax=Microbacterium oleivorans TaxID=273677 RepID=UPI003F540677